MLLPLALTMRVGASVRPRPRTAGGSMLQPPGFGTKPHLITIIMDDFGWNSVGFHGHNPEIQTPTMDALALSGLRLDRHCEAAAHLCPSLHPTHCRTGDLIWISGPKRISPFK